MRYNLGMKTERKLQRSGKDYLLLGVCGGLAEYLEVDATVVRLVFLLMGLWGGSGLLIYLALGLIMPRGKKEDVKIRESGAKGLTENGRGGFGYVLILAGVLLLINRFMPMHIRGDWFWPVVLVGAGAWLLMRK